MKLVQVLMMAMTLSIFAITASAGVESLRGDSAPNSNANAISKHKQMKVKGGIKRNYKLQPPLIPHSIEKDRITLRGNTCLKCHSEKNHKKEKAPAIGKSHYLDRDGKRLTKVSKRRWFCNQCHAPQMQADPLVQNNY